MESTRRAHLLVDFVPEEAMDKKFWVVEIEDKADFVFISGHDDITPACTAAREKESYIVVFNYQ